MRRTYLFIISLFLAAQLLAQNEQDQLPQGAPKKINKFDIRPYGLRLGVDISDIGVSLFDDDRTRYGINLDLDIHKYLFQIDGGYARSTYTEEDLIYRSEGVFYRVGIDYNFMYFNEQASAIFLGARYANAVTYDDEIAFVLGDPIFGSEIIRSEVENRSANWLEITTGIKARVLENIFIGFTARYKFRRRGNRDQIVTFDLPGFGRTDRMANLGLNYYVYYRLPFRKKDLIRPDRN
ncbi:MAG: DUF6048 family protein [Bacteroidota bacterium]